MIENIGKPGFDTLSSVSEHVLFCMERLKIEKPNQPLHICEVGVGIGTTSVQIVKRLLPSDFFYLFDFQKKVDNLMSDLQTFECHISGYGNSTKTWDSYVWTLVHFFLNQAKSKNIFDLVYLDGAHTFFHDSSSSCIIKELLNVGGYFVLDDVYWTYEKSPTSNPTKNPNLRNLMTDEQISTPHVELITKAFLDTDCRFTRVIDEMKLKKWRAVYKKIL